ncbi:hypothetical protein [Hyalangium rubrum]|uniref:Uncharacterized protein n=1 Tax=Hyalangium rubrum TaxID=3103134 RepID=A0ABU5H8G3_9BACT|nr:hypothetical protein [Hyalangium sp. s54d21]MDY7229531.1 hypothetical protein [Hyalangium sp. s54d21]
MRNSFLIAAILLGSAPAFAEYHASFSATPGPGKNFAFRVSTAPTASTQYQGLSFLLNTSNSGKTNPVPHHFAFSVRGPDQALTCVSGLSNFRWLGRGIAVYPTEGLVAFENFTKNCQTGDGLVNSTLQSVTINSYAQYNVSVWANHYNIGYTIEKQITNGEGYPEWVTISSGDCRSQASAAEASECGEWTAVPGFVDRGSVTWVGNTGDERYWSVSNWYTWNYW